MNSKIHWWLYVLKLEQDKWYVGITTKTPEARYREHVMNIRSAAWTRLHRPVKLVDKEDLGYIDKEVAESREDKITLAYMKKYGINNVRGGQYVETENYVQNGRDFYRQDVWQTRNIALRIIVVLMVLLVIASVVLIKILESRN